MVNAHDKHIQHDDHTTSDAAEYEATDIPTEEPAANETSEYISNEVTEEEITETEVLAAAKQAAEDELQRVKADFLNTKRRLEDERARDKERHTVRFIENLLPALDSFDMAMKDTETWNTVDQQWRNGIEGIYSQLQSVLDAYNAHAFDPSGSEFDPARHEALSNQPVEDQAQHNIVQGVIQRGYEIQLADKTELVRPARVLVGEWNDTATNE